MYVLCKGCHDPEIVIKIKGKGKDMYIKAKCQACGHNGRLNNTHKLATYIVKNPPTHKNIIVIVDE